MTEKRESSACVKNMHAFLTHVVSSTLRSKGRLGRYSPKVSSMQHSPTLASPLPLPLPLPVPVPVPVTRVTSIHHVYTRQTEKQRSRKNAFLDSTRKSTYTHTNLDTRPPVSFPTASHTRLYPDTRVSQLQPVSHSLLTPSLCSTLRVPVLFP